MKELYAYGGEIIQVSDEDYLWLAGFKWSIGSKGYAKTYTNKKNIWMHKIIGEKLRIKRVDHIDRNVLNNQRKNLREATRIQNGQNQNLHKNSISGYKGVSYHKQHCKWQARITVNKKVIHLGYFNNPINAAQAYDIAAKKYFDEFAVLNFIPS